LLIKAIDNTDSNTILHQGCSNCVVYVHELYQLNNLLTEI